MEHFLNLFCHVRLRKNEYVSGHHSGMMLLPSVNTVSLSFFLCLWSQGVQVVCHLAGKIPKIPAPALCFFQARNNPENGRRSAKESVGKGMILACRCVCALPMNVVMIVCSCELKCQWRILWMPGHSIFSYCLWSNIGEYASPTQPRLVSANACLPCLAISDLYEVHNSDFSWSLRSFESLKYHKVIDQHGSIFNCQTDKGLDAFVVPIFYCLAIPTLVMFIVLRRFLRDLTVGT